MSWQQMVNSQDYVHWYTNQKKMCIIDVKNEARHICVYDADDNLAVSVSINEISYRN